MAAGQGGQGGTPGPGGKAGESSSPACPEEEGRSRLTQTGAAPLCWGRRSSWQCSTCEASGEKNQGAGESSSPRHPGRGWGRSAFQQGGKSGVSESGPDGVSVPASACGFGNEGETWIEAKSSPQGFTNLQPLGTHSDWGLQAGSILEIILSTLLIVHLGGQTWRKPASRRAGSRSQRRLPQHRDPGVMQGAGSRGPPAPTLALSNSVEPH